MKKLYYLMRILHEKLVINNPNAPYPKIPLHKFILKLWLINNFKYLRIY